jgi:hypothetical protein
LPFVSSLEEDVLNRICRVGSYFKKLENFVLERRSGQQGLAVIVVYPHSLYLINHAPGAYLAALALTLDRHLDDYRDLVSSLDDLVTQGDDVTLSRVQHAVGSEEEVFEMLYKQLEEFQADEVGALIQGTERFVGIT